MRRHIKAFSFKSIFFLAVIFLSPGCSYGTDGGGEFYEHGKEGGEPSHVFRLGRGFVPFDEEKNKVIKAEGLDSLRKDSEDLENQQFEKLPLEGGTQRTLLKEEHFNFPNMACGQIFSMFSPKQGSGKELLSKSSAVMISPHCALTCGHGICLSEEKRLIYENHQHIVRSVIFAPGLYEEDTYFQVVAERKKVPQEWFVEGNKSYDFSLLYFEEPIGLKTGYVPLGFVERETDPKSLGDISIIGYPGWNNNRPQVSTGQVLDLSDGLISYNVNTTMGIAGAPILRGDPKYPQCIGIHTTGFSKKDQKKLNKGVLITKEKYDRIEKWLRDVGELP